MKRTLTTAALLLIAALTLFPAASAAQGGITEDILNTFGELALIPRPSHHEKAISDYLMAWAAGLGFAVEQDALYNLIIDVPATPGMEDRPLVALQAHMDMVFAAKPGSDADPLTAAITVVNDGTYLSSDGSTSLGADDGIGLAIIMNAAMGKMAHGPLRLIVTTAEEDGMTGTFGLDPAHLCGVPYLINMDAEEEGSMCLSTAACVIESFTAGPELADAETDAALRIEISGLRGGHSGLDIGKGRLNAICAAAEMLRAADDAGIGFELAAFTGGSAPNAIPVGACAVICVPSRDLDAARQALADSADAIKARHADTDSAMTITIEETEWDGRVLTNESKGRALGYIAGVTNGVYTMSRDIEGLVESSSNLGLFSAGEDGITAVTCVRSSSPEGLREMLESDARLAGSLGIALTQEKSADPWPYDPDSRLADTADRAYLALYGKPIGHLTVHAGLECGTFSVYNRDLEMIAIGPTLYDVHTVNERLEIASIEKVWCLLERILADI